MQTDVNKREGSSKNVENRKSVTTWGYWPPQLVEHSDVSIHVVKVVGVGWVPSNVPFLWFGALTGEHVTAVLGLVVHTIETRHLRNEKQLVKASS